MANSIETMRGGDIAIYSFNDVPIATKFKIDGCTVTPTKPLLEGGCTAPMNVRLDGEDKLSHSDTINGCSTSLPRRKVYVSRKYWTDGSMRDMKKVSSVDGSKADDSIRQRRNRERLFCILYGSVLEGKYAKLCAKRSMQQQFIQVNASSVDGWEKSTVGSTEGERQDDSDPGGGENSSFPSPENAQNGMYVGKHENVGLTVGHRGFVITKTTDKKGQREENPSSYLQELERGSVTGGKKKREGGPVGKNRVGSIQRCASSEELLERDVALNIKEYEDAQRNLMDKYGLSPDTPFDTSSGTHVMTLRSQSAFQLLPSYFEAFTDLHMDACNKASVSGEVSEPYIKEGIPSAGAALPSVLPATAPPRQRLHKKHTYEFRRSKNRGKNGETLPTGVFFWKDAYVANWFDSKKRKQFKVTFKTVDYGDEIALKLANLAREKRSMNIEYLSQFLEDENVMMEGWRSGIVRRDGQKGVMGVGMNGNPKVCRGNENGVEDRSVEPKIERCGGTRDLKMNSITNEMSFVQNTIRSNGGRKKWKGTLRGLLPVDEVSLESMIHPLSSIDGTAIKDSFDFNNGKERKEDFIRSNAVTTQYPVEYCCTSTSRGWTGVEEDVLLQQSGPELVDQQKEMIIDTIHHPKHPYGLTEPSIDAGICNEQATISRKRQFSVLNNGDKQHRTTVDTHTVATPLTTCATTTSPTRSSSASPERHASSLSNAHDENWLSTNEHTITSSETRSNDAAFGASEEEVHTFTPDNNSSLKYAFNSPVNSHNALVHGWTHEDRTMFPVECNGSTLSTPSTDSTYTPFTRLKKVDSEWNEDRNDGLKLHGSNSNDSCTRWGDDTYDEVSTKMVKTANEDIFAHAALGEFVIPEMAVAMCKQIAKLEKDRNEESENETPHNQIGNSCDVWLNGLGELKPECNFIADGQSNVVAVNDAVDAYYHYFSKLKYHQ